MIFRRIQWNFGWSLLYNCLGIPVAAGVFYPLVHVRLPPTLAAMAMALSSISVVLSSLTLRWYRPPEIEVLSASRQRRRRERTRRQEERAQRRQRRLSIESADGGDLQESLLENDHHLEHSEVTEATEPTDNRTPQRTPDSNV